MNQVWLDDWYEHPVYCPFCGTPIGPDTEGKECKHLLFVVWECMFYYASDRFTTLTGTVADGYPLPNGLNSGKGVETIIQKVDEPNYVVFEIASPSDVGRVGFASFDEELCGWGRSPNTPSPW